MLTKDEPDQPKIEESEQERAAREAAERASSWPRGYTKAEIAAARRDAERLGYGRKREGDDRSST